MTAPLNTAPAAQFARLLRREDLAADPFTQFETWFQEAKKAVSHPFAMTLATVTPAGQPTVRTVLLKHHDEEGFVFFTEANTRKAEHIAANPEVSLLFPWLTLNRQVTISGQARKLNALAAAKCMLLGENNGVTNRTALEIQLSEIKHRLKAGTFSLAPSFCAFRVEPATVEFWQGRGPKEHDRYVYTREADQTWAISELP